MHAFEYADSTDSGFAGHTVDLFPDQRQFCELFEPQSLWIAGLHRCLGVPVERYFGFFQLSMNSNGFEASGRGSATENPSVVESSILGCCIFERSSVATRGGKYRTYPDVE